MAGVHAGSSVPAGADHCSREPRACGGGVLCSSPSPGCLRCAACQGSALRQHWSMNGCTPFVHAWMMTVVFKGLGATDCDSEQRTGRSTGCLWSCCTGLQSWLAAAACTPCAALHLELVGACRAGGAACDCGRHPGRHGPVAHLLHHQPGLLELPHPPRLPRGPQSGGGGLAPLLAHAFQASIAKWGWVNSICQRWQKWLPS